MPGPEPTPAPRLGIATLSGLAAAGVGLLYITYTFGPTEAEVVTWGQISFFSGLALVFLVMLARRVRIAPLRVAVVLALSVITLLQVLPALLWVLFHAQGISDGSPPSTFVAHWVYALPHVAVIVLSGAAAYRFLGRPRTGST